MRVAYGYQMSHPDHALGILSLEYPMLSDKPTRRPGRPRKQKPDERLTGPARKLGRRPHGDLAASETRQQILNSAEKVFADFGYLGASLQQVAKDAGVTTALTTYYFKSKKNLYSEVYRRRADVLTNRRRQRLEELRSRDVPAELSEIVAAYVRPQFEMRRESEGGKHFARLQARILSEPEEIVRPLRRKIYDKTLRAFATEMEATSGPQSAADIGWGVTFMIGIILYMLRDVDRIGEFSEGRFHLEEDDALIEKIVQFIVGGISAARNGAR